MKKRSAAPDNQTIHFPAFEEPLMDAPPVSPLTVMRETRAVRNYYLLSHDSPEKRLREKTTEPFRLD
jgi:hypothetical protein